MRLGHGQFLGRYQASRQVDGRALAELRPVVPEHEVEPHAHDDAHLLLLLDGDYVSSAQGMPALCRAPALVLNPPGTVHRDRFRGLDGRFFTVSWPAQRWRAALGQRSLPLHPQRLGATAVARAFALWRELRHWDTASTLAVQSGFESLLDEATLDTRLASGAGPAWLERARECLADEWRATPDLAALARIADVHPVYLARAFRRRYGCSPAAYLRRCRMARAIELLHGTRLRLAAIAARCGYADQSHFTHAFRRAHRCTPSQYREWTAGRRQVPNLQGGAARPC